jgi:hypothetical protein
MIMKTRLISLVGLITVLLAVQGSLAAEQDDFKRPKYSPVLRQNEDWSALAGQDKSQTGNFFDPIKYIPLSKDGNYWMSFGGQVRFRFEGWRNFNFNKAFDDTFLLTRIRLHTDIHTGEYLRFFAEIKSAFSTDRDLPGGRRSFDVDELDLQQGFADVMLPLGESGKLTFRAGRQFLLFGKQRLVSPLDWLNTMRTWDGFQGIYSLDNWKISGFGTQFVPIKKFDLNKADSGQPFAGIHVTRVTERDGIGLDGYWLYRERKALDEKRHTVGGRIFGKVGHTGIDYDFEAAYQYGDSGDKDVKAFMIGSQFGYRFTETAIKPRVYFGFDYGSGDKDPNDNKVRTFDQIYPLAHAFLGYIDIVGRQNIIDPNLGITFVPLNKLTCEVDGHFFWRAEEEDALYNAAGIEARKGGPGTSLEVGQEVDFLLKYAHNLHTLILVGYSHFFPGEFIKQTGPSDPVDFIYASIQYTF